MDSLQKDKNMGLDCWSVEFFIGFYDWMEDGTQRVEEETRKTRRVFGTFNSTIFYL
jgi:hypothetical protein